MKSCEGHAWKQVRPVVLKGTRLPRLRALLHESAALCELTGDGRDKVTKQRATTRTGSGRGVLWWVKCLAALVILAMAETVVRSSDRVEESKTRGAVACRASAWNDLYEMMAGLNKRLACVPPLIEHCLCEG